MIMDLHNYNNYYEIIVIVRIRQLEKLSLKVSSCQDEFFSLKTDFVNSFSTLQRKLVM